MGVLSFMGAWNVAPALLGGGWESRGGQGWGGSWVPEPEAVSLGAPRTGWALDSAALVGEVRVLSVTLLFLGLSQKLFS